MNPDELDIAGQQEAAIPPAKTPTPPARQEVVETPEQIFRRVLGYLYIEEAFVTSILNTQRIRNFRVAVILTGEQRSNVLTKAQSNDDEGFTHDALSFLKLLDAADHYTK